jgi:large subunit ribosomal protein L29
MELEKIRNLSDDELQHHEKTSAEQLFRLRFQVSLGQNDGVKRLRQLRKEIAQVKTVARERELGVRGAKKEVVATPAAKPASAKTATAKATTGKSVSAKPATAKKGSRK